ncbi:MAG: 23S rRNA (uracil(1939)-C(5))-methyltransferase RlmD [Firmicutes bacterium]|nr:23S rRNA (uracil(1939)-C(5))-methyltransferase RlmD [Bacillota bacterium]
MALKKNDLITVNIDGMTAEGSGVAHYEGMAVFVPNAAPNDCLSVKIIKLSKNYAVGKIQQIITPGDGRIMPDCPSYPKCGGCTFRHLDYAEECRIKLQRVNDAMKRIGGIDIEAEEFIAAENPDRYRNKAQFPFGNEQNRAVFGFYAERSHRIVPFTDCRLQPEIFNAIAQATANFINDTPNDIYDETTGKGRFRHLYIRRGFATGEIMVCAVVNANGLAKEDEFIKRIRAVSPEIKSIIINTNRERTNVIMGAKCRTAWGKDTISDILCGVKFEISPLSFYQVNREQAEKLYNCGREYAGLTGKEVLFDIYCGTGTIGLSMAASARALYGIEIIPDAVENARRNAAANCIENAEFICADAADGARQLKERGISPDVVVIDPPRKGCSAEVIELIDEMSPKRVVYISCDPATLARDIARFAEYGWKAQRLTAVDMFPRTANVECVVLLTKVQK